MSRFRRERDNYKQMLEAAQKTIAEDKSGEKRAKRNSISSTDEVLKCYMYILYFSYIKSNKKWKLIC